MDLSIVIISWNVCATLLDTLASIYANPPDGSFDVWVVDNQSADGSPQAVRQQYPQVCLIETGANLGFAAGNNVGIRASTGRIVLLLNPDTIVHPGALNTLVRYLNDHPQAGAAGSHLLNPDGSLQISSYPFPTPGREFWRLFHLDHLFPLAAYPVQKWQSAKPEPVDMLQGASLALRREALDQVGLLDESYFMYTEEVDLCYRLHQAGWGIFWLPDSKVTHLGGQSTRQAAQSMFVSLYRTKAQFIRKHFGAGAAARYRIVLTLASLARLLLAPLAWLLSTPSRRPQQKGQAANYAHLLRHIPTF